MFLVQSYVFHLLPPTTLLRRCPFNIIQYAYVNTNLVTIEAYARSQC